MEIFLKTFGQDRGIGVVSRTRAENQMETCGVHLDGTLFFYLRRGELPGCLLRLQRGVAPNAHRLALLYTHEASRQATEAGVAVISA